MSYVRERNLKNKDHNYNGINVASYPIALQLSLSHKIQAIKLKLDVVLSQKLPSCKKYLKICGLRQVGGKIHALF